MVAYLGIDRAILASMARINRYREIGTKKDSKVVRIGRPPSTQTIMDHTVE